MVALETPFKGPKQDSPAVKVRYAMLEVEGLLANGQQIFQQQVVVVREFCTCPAEAGNTPETVLSRGF